MSDLRLAVGLQSLRASGSGVAPAGLLSLDPARALEEGPHELARRRDPAREARGQKLQPVVAPEQLAVPDKGWNAEDAQAQGLVRHLAEPLLDVGARDALPEIIGVETSAGDDVADRAEVGQVCSLPPARVR